MRLNLAMLILLIGFVTSSSLTRDALVDDLGSFMETLRISDDDGDDRMLSALDRLKFHLASMTHSGRGLSKKQAKLAKQASLRIEQALDSLEQARTIKSGGAEETTIDQVANLQAIASSRSTMYHAAAALALASLHAVKDLIAPETYSTWLAELEAVSPVYQPESLEALLEVAVARRLIAHKLANFLRIREEHVMEEMGEILSHICKVPELLEIAWVKHDEFKNSQSYRDLARLGPRLESYVSARNQAYAQLCKDAGGRVDDRGLTSALREVDTMTKVAVRMNSGMNVKSMWDHMHSGSRSLSPFERWSTAVRRKHAAELALETQYDLLEAEIAKLLKPRTLKDRLAVAEAAWVRSGVVLVKRKEATLEVYQSLDTLSRDRLASVRSGGSLTQRFSDPSILKVCEALGDEHEVALEILRKSIEPISSIVKSTPEIEEALSSLREAETRMEDAKAYELRVCHNAHAVRQAALDPPSTTREVQMAVQMAQVIKSIRLALEASEAQHEAYGKYLRAVQALI